MRLGRTSNDSDCLNLDKPTRHGQRCNTNEGGRGGLLAKELLSNRGQLGAVPDVDEEGGELHNVGERAASRFHLGLEGGVGCASLGGEIPWVPGLPLGVVVHLA